MKKLFNFFSGIIGLISFLMPYFWDSLKKQFKSGIKTDEFPSGKGKFGFDVTNPIPCKGFLGPNKYLQKIEFADKSSFRFERHGSTGAENINAEHIDIYSIYKNGKKHSDLYLAPYQKRTSRKVPEGFIFKS